MAAILVPLVARFRFHAMHIGPLRVDHDQSSQQRRTAIDARVLRRRFIFALLTRRQRFPVR
eukprot:5521870-Pleurochrysis_carterae.AAC.1